MKQKQKASAAPPSRLLSPEEKIRTAVNNAAVELVGAGFSAIDEAAKQGTDWLKKQIIRGIGGK